MRMKRTMMAGLGALALAGCATTRPVEVTRFHLNQPIARGTIDVEPLAAGGPASLEFKTYAAAVQGQLLQLGYTSPPPGQTGQFLATVNFVRTSRGVIDEGPPVTLGLGVGGFGRHVGGGVGGGNRHRQASPQGTDHRRAFGQDHRSRVGSAIWEGRAQRDGAVGSEQASPAATAAKLASALFKGFPGKSGRTIKVS